PFAPFRSVLRSSPFLVWYPVPRPAIPYQLCHGPSQICAEHAEPPLPAVPRDSVQAGSSRQHPGPWEYAARDSIPPAPASRPEADPPPPANPVERVSHRPADPVALLSPHP